MEKFNRFKLYLLKLTNISLHIDIPTAIANIKNNIYFRDAHIPAHGADIRDRIRIGHQRHLADKGIVEEPVHNDPYQHSGILPVFSHIAFGP